MKSSFLGFLAVAGLVLGARPAPAQTIGATAAGTEQQLLEQLSASPQGAATSLTATGGGGLNLTQVTQQGALNAAQIAQVGSGNLTIITQVGAGNVAVSTITGNGTTSEITQNGSRNVVDQQLVVDQRRYLVQQLGNDNRLQQAESGARAPAGYEVKMTGNGINMIIQQGQATYRP